MGVFDFQPNRGVSKERWRNAIAKEGYLGKGLGISGKSEGGLSTKGGGGVKGIGNGY